MVIIKVKTKNILSSGAIEGEVHIVYADSSESVVVDVDRAFYSATFASRNLLLGVSEDFTVADGESGNQKKAFGNRRRVKLIAFLVDAAGNRSALTETSETSQPYYGGADLDENGTINEDEQLVYIIDSQKPTVTMTRPKGGTTDPDSLRFTALDTGIVQIREAE